MPNIKDQICGGDQFEALAAASQGTAYIAPVTRSRPTGALRWRLQPPSEGHGKALQQEFEITVFTNGTPTRHDVEWRDVPIVAE